MRMVSQEHSSWPRLEESHSHQGELGHSSQDSLGVSPALCGCGANAPAVPQGWLWLPAGGKAELLFAPLPTFFPAPLLSCYMLVADLVPYPVLSPASEQVRLHSQSLTSTEVTPCYTWAAWAGVWHRPDGNLAKCCVCITVFPAFVVHLQNPT